MGNCSGSAPAGVVAYSFTIGRKVFSWPDRKTIRRPSGVQATGRVPVP